MIKKRFKYIDLFAGIGGFHQAMRRLGGRCVYACEKNDDCRTFYDRNYNQDGSIKFHDDVRTIRPEDIPDFDVLCAGFPCQPFSKAGMRLGFEDKGRGDLFYSLLPILDRHQEAKFVILENVRNLADTITLFRSVILDFTMRNRSLTLMNKRLKAYLMLNMIAPWTTWQI